MGDADDVGSEGAHSAASLGQRVAAATCGSLNRSGRGYTVTIPHGSREIVVRLMEEGGGRKNFYRVSVAGKETYTVEGTPSTDRSLMHIPVAESSFNDIMRIVGKIQSQ